MLFFLKKLYRKFGMNSLSFFKFSRDSQKKYIDSLKIPNTAIEKSYNQYLCQKFLMNKLIVFIMNIISYFLIPIYEMNLLKNEKKYQICIEKCDAVFFTDGIGVDTLPKSLIQQYKKIKTIKFGEKIFISKEELAYFNNIKNWRKYPPYFRLKIILKAAMYFSAIKLYNPKAFFSYCESSFTSQIITEWLENKSIKNINIMHGEKLYLIADSFSSFSEFYVWDEHYKNLLIELKADKNQFIVELPLKLNTVNKNHKKSYDSNNIYDITYYLSDEGEKELSNIAEILKKMNNYKIKIRMHPRGNNKQLVEKCFNDFFIEYPNDVSLVDSFDTTRYICSLNSTVLFEGYLNGKEVIIDDISNKTKFEKQKDLEYIMFKKKHILLSKMLME